MFQGVHVRANAYHEYVDILRFPDELLYMVMASVDVVSQERLRLCCRRLAQIGYYTLNEARAVHYVYNAPHTYMLLSPAMRERTSVAEMALSKCPRLFLDQQTPEVVRGQKKMYVTAMLAALILEERELLFGLDQFAKAQFSWHEQIEIQKIRRCCEEQLLDRSSLRRPILSERPLMLLSSAQQKLCTYLPVVIACANPASRLSRNIGVNVLTVRSDAVLCKDIALLFAKQYEAAFSFFNRELCEDADIQKAVQMGHKST